jgi:RNA polymerase-binding transcription factor DksA
MTNAEIQRYRRRLLSLKRRLGADLWELEEETLRPVGGESAGGLSDVPVHLADLGTENFEEEVALDLIENEDHILRQINEALERIDQSGFGGCRNCHRPISHERLEALPFAAYCIRCAREIQGESAPD